MSFDGSHKLHISKKLQVENIRYTRLSTLLYMIALYKQNKQLNLVCYSNSISVLVSIISSSIVAPESYKNLINSFASIKLFYLLNFCFHYMPVYFFYRLNRINNITFKSCSSSMVLNLFWGVCVKYDLNNIYGIMPPLQYNDKKKLITINLISHYLLYMIKQINNNI